MQTINEMKIQIQTLIKELEFWHKMYTEAMIMNQAKSLQTTVSVLRDYEQSLKLFLVPAKSKAIKYTQ